MDSVKLLCNKFHSSLKECLEPMGKNPMIPLLKYELPAIPNGQKSEPIVTPKRPIEELFEKAKEEDSPEATAHLLYAILLAEVVTTFHKINVHAAMTPTDVKKHFEPIFNQAKCFLESKYRAPKEKLIVTVRINNIYTHKYEF